MDMEEIIGLVAKHGQQIVANEHRIKNLEEFQKKQNELIISVNKLANNMEQMLEEQKTQGERLQMLEHEPIERWTSTKKAFFNACLGAAASVLTGGAIWLLLFVARSM